MRLSAATWNVVQALSRVPALAGTMVMVFPVNAMSNRVLGSEENAPTIHFLVQRPLVSVPPVCNGGPYWLDAPIMEQLMQWRSIVMKRFKEDPLLQANITDRNLFKPIRDHDDRLIYDGVCYLRFLCVDQVLGDMRRADTITAAQIPFVGLKDLLVLGIQIAGCLLPTDKNDNTGYAIDVLVGSLASLSPDNVVNLSEDQKHAARHFVKMLQGSAFSTEKWEAYLGLNTSDN
ncbi:uncharacterized protein DSM5745_04544 [Aspergillus mulundensis]|uniref:Uncharacterized protein n=1 Tax=Aspergillus mulundensis TaxID=1810919 RepID=A0A3D8SEM9_9EURO|nr:hypothetical protein DSM5745_04544 [Aspergillus mulundensis]RDW84218.1 hypothetical protein DSM5745_04544 [Aspergillus mulundensis]